MAASVMPLFSYKLGACLHPNRTALWLPIDDYGLHGHWRDVANRVHHIAHLQLKWHKAKCTGLEMLTFLHPFGVDWCWFKYWMHYSLQAGSRHPYCRSLKLWCLVAKNGPTGLRCTLDMLLVVFWGRTSRRRLSPISFTSSYSVRAHESHLVWISIWMQDEWQVHAFCPLLIDQHWMEGGEREKSLNLCICAIGRFLIKNCLWRMVCHWGAKMCFRKGLISQTVALGWSWSISLLCSEWVSDSGGY